MCDVLLDASALLALIHNESGQDRVASVIDSAAISAVNLAEVVGKLAERGIPADRAAAIPTALGLDIIPLDAALASRAGQLRPLTRSAGLSLGDRCCLATAEKLSLPVLTTEEVWRPLAAALGLDIRNIRHPA